MHQMMNLTKASAGESNPNFGYQTEDQQIAFTPTYFNYENQQNK